MVVELVVVVEEEDEVEEKEMMVMVRRRRRRRRRRRGRRVCLHDKQDDAQAPAIHCFTVSSETSTLQDLRRRKGKSSSSPTSTTHLRGQVAGGTTKCLHE